MLFKSDSINEDVTLGALVMLAFHCILSCAPISRPSVMGSILETLTIGLTETNGPDGTDCSVLALLRWMVCRSKEGGYTQNILPMGNKTKNSVPSAVLKAMT